MVEGEYTEEDKQKDFIEDFKNLVDQYGYLTDEAVSIIVGDKFKNAQLKYRVVELNNKFDIQIYAYKENGILWWRRKKWYWVTTNAWGGAWFGFPIAQPYSKTFDSLEEANKQIEMWLEKPKYHYLNDKNYDTKQIKESDQKN